MTKLDNDGQVVKKEIFKLTPRYISRFVTSSLSESAEALIDELFFITYLGAIGKNRGEQIKDVNLIKFEYFLNPHDARSTNYIFTINSLRQAAQELEEKATYSVMKMDSSCLRRGKCDE